MAGEARDGRPGILITGGTGLLGIGWACALRDTSRVVCATHRHSLRLAGVESIPLDLESVDGLRRTLEARGRPTVVHTAAMASVDECERNPEAARHVNAGLAENVARAAADLDCPLIHISTDHLFAGPAQSWSETDTPRPLNRYAETKLEAEERVLSAWPRALVIRTNFFGWGSAGRRSFSDWIIDNLRTGRQVTLFDDVFYSPILIEALALAAHELTARNVAGVVNLGGDDALTKHAFGVRLAERFGLDRALIRRGKLADSRLGAPRPTHMSLDNGLATRKLGRRVGSLDSFLDTLARQEASGLAGELENAVTE